MAIRRISHLIAVLVVGSLLAACQSAAIEDVRQHAALSGIAAAVVEPFDVTGVVWIGDHGEHTPEEVRGELRLELIRQLRARGVQVGDHAGPGSVITRGSLDLVDAGSGVARALVGMGSGQSKFVCTVDIVDGASGQSAYSLTVSGGSKGSSGIVFGAGYKTLADARDAAEQIAEFVETLK